jgi:hypothetical protein
VGALLLLVPTAAAARAADLAVTSVVAPAKGLTTTGGQKLAVTVKNAGGTAVPRAALVAYLSADKKAGGTDMPLGFGQVPALKPGAVKKVSVATAPAQAGSYYVVACVSAPGVRQSSSKNDCASTKNKVKVGGGGDVSPPGAGPPVFATVTTLDPLESTATIGPEGGALTTHGIDGSTITLTIPKDGLLVPTTLHLVPAAVSQGPAGVQPLSAALIEPEGLTVFGATIEFQAPAGISRAQLTGVAFGGEDESIVRTAFLGSTGLKIDVGLLGGYGVGVKTSAKAARSLFSVRGCLQSFVAALDPCQSESLRKQFMAIMSGVTPERAADVLAAYRAFEANILLPAIEAAINAGAQADELDPMVSIMGSADRAFALLGIEPEGQSALLKLASIMGRVVANTIAACAAGKQGPLLTQNRFNALERQAAVMGVELPSSARAQLDSDCMSKPYYVTYTLGATARGMSDFAPWLSGGQAKATDVRVPAPKTLGGSPQPGIASLAFSGLTCNPGGNDTCTFTSSSGSITVKVVKETWSTREVQRCGRKVKVPDLVLTFELKLDPADRLTARFCRNGECTEAPIMNSFDEATFVATNQYKVDIREAGGTTSISGSGAPHGLTVTGAGSVKMSLTAGG